MSVNRNFKKVNVNLLLNDNMTYDFIHRNDVLFVHSVYVYSILFFA